MKVGALSQTFVDKKVIDDIYICSLEVKEEDILV
jgi:hypothetical protein